MKDVRYINHGIVNGLLASIYIFAIALVVAMAWGWAWALIPLCLGLIGTLANA